MLVTVNELIPHFPQGYFDGGNYHRADEIIRGVESFIRRYTNNDFICRETGCRVYPPDVRLGAIGLIKWELNDRREKAGIASETISRHSVSYSSDTESAAGNGYPASLLGFLKPYMRARF